MGTGERGLSSLFVCAGVCVLMCVCVCASEGLVCVYVLLRVYVCVLVRVRMNVLCMWVGGECACTLACQINAPPFRF